LKTAEIWYTIFGLYHLEKCFRIFHQMLPVSKHHQTVKLNVNKDMSCSSEEEAVGKIHRCVMMLSVGQLEDGWCIYIVRMIMCNGEIWFWPSGSDASCIIVGADHSSKGKK
jgi:hypothetical protein